MYLVVSIRTIDDSDANDRGMETMCRGPGKPWKMTLGRVQGFLAPRSIHPWNDPNSIIVDQLLSIGSDCVEFGNKSKPGTANLQPGHTPNTTVFCSLSLLNGRR